MSFRLSPFCVGAWALILSGLLSVNVVHAQTNEPAPRDAGRCGQWQESGCGQAAGDGARAACCRMTRAEGNRRPGRNMLDHRPRGQSSTDRFDSDHDLFFYLLANREVIERQITPLTDGVETVTESTDPAVAEKIREHVRGMQTRVENGYPIHMRDPLFREIFRHADKIEMEVVDTERGVRVVETSKDAYVARLIQAHAEVVSKFIENGHAEMRRDHVVPAE